MSIIIIRLLYMIAKIDELGKNFIPKKTKKYIFIFLNFTINLLIYYMPHGNGIISIFVMNDKYTI